ncbi:MAG TPA: Crp/Fnr family transcriptional regulator [Ohtaekwangia sp.]|uniref:Crp/Fnr family transcriptional regulator n=1 Tax=Ohtaekwangia sp. TaxID=2066019 RepID=UPI002F93E076
MKLRPESFPEFRRHLERFIKINDEEFEQILAYFTYKKLKKHEILIQTGDKVKYTYWTRKGLLISTFIDHDGGEHIIQFANENCWITDQNAFYNRAEAIFTITCREDSELLCLSYRNREKLCAGIHKMEHFFRKKANDSFVKQQRRLLTFLTSDAGKRYDLLLSEYPELIQRLSKKVLAAYLGISRETMSRLGK